MNEIRIGTCGWSYPSGAGAWNGLFYPPRGTRGHTSRGFDELAYYADHFNTVEVNSTFYRPPVATVTQRWAGRTPPGFDFSLKLYQKFTHVASIGRSPGPPARGASGAANTIPEVGQPQVDEFRAAIDPLAEAGKLAALLAQFPPSFRQSDASLEYLAWLLTAFREYGLAVELRHRSWSDHLATTLRLLNQAGAAWVQIDEPKFRFSIRQNYLPNQKGLYYMRLHGRNAAKWWQHENADERYNYLYSPEELKEFAETATTVRALVKKSYIYLNNHFAAKAIVDAVVLKRELGEPITGEYRPELVSAYPFLKDIVVAAQGDRLPLSG